MDIEKAKPLKCGDAKLWIQKANIRIARLPKSIISFLSLIFLAFTVLAGPSQALAEMLSWTESSGQASGYLIYYGQSCNDLRRSINVGNVLKYSLDSMPLDENKSYCFAVKAYSQSVESPFSNTVYWTSGDNTPPSPPVEVIAE